MKISLARIIVQNNFCGDCIFSLKDKITNEIDGLSNIKFYSEDSLIVFNYNRLNQISEVLNKLSSLGYPQIGDKINPNNYKSPFCNCNK